ncbi:hypothetical protein HDV02_000136 [Globomyces sp. JEL0801]|nr:hypothetical protein HDV02_000136 [Globomyces sp. JEL0801]
MTEFRVVIIGGGLVGSLAAVYLGNKGYTVDVYEKRPGLLYYLILDIRLEKTANGRSINLALSERGIKALEGAGVMNEIAPNLIPMRGRYVHVTNTSHNMQDYGIFVLLTVAEKLNNVNLHFGYGVSRCDFDKGEVTLVNDKKEEKFLKGIDFIIGADGAYSRVRDQLLRNLRMDFSREYIDHGYVELNMPPLSNGDYAMDSNHLHIWPRKTFMMIALPNLDHSFTVTLFMPWDKFDSIKTPDELLHFFDTTFGDAVPLIGRKLLVEDYFKNAKGSLVSVKCKPYNFKGRAVIVGDAAHAMVPFYGQGMNCGFEDILVLDEIFTKHIQPNSIPTKEQMNTVLTEYSQIRNPDAHAICDLALNNYVEMRSSVIDPKYLFRKKVESFLHRIIPQTVTPLYSMVSFSRTRYSEALAKYKKQTKWFEAFWTGLHVVKYSALATCVGYSLYKYQVFTDFFASLSK